MAEILNPNEMFYTMFEPKVKNRFIMYCDGVPSFIIKKTDRPKVAQAAKEINYINQKWFHKGRAVWGSLALELYDPIVPSGAQAVMEWFRLHHESTTGRNGYMEFYKKNIVVNVLGPPGDLVEEWTLIGCHITDLTFGESTWDNDGDAHVINVTLQPDYCILHY